MSENTSRTTNDHLRPVLRDLADLLDTSGASEQSAPTPCAEYSVAELRQHTLGWLTAFADGFASDDGVCSDPGVVVVGDDPGAQVRAAAEKLHAAVDAGAGERPLYIGDSPMPGEMGLQMILGEYQVHGWDLAKATGAAWSPGPDGLAASAAFLDAMLTPDFQGEGKSFSPRVPVGDDASALDTLVALTGRDPQWSAQGRS